jgi:hypothetical protein
MLVEHVSSEIERKEHATSGMQALDLGRIRQFEAQASARQQKKSLKP